MYSQSVTIYPFSLKFLWVLPYYIMLITGVILPSDGNHGLLSFKSLGFLGTGGSLILHLLTQRHFVYQQFQAMFAFLLFLTFLCVWMLLGDMSNRIPWESQFDQFKIFLITGFVWAVSIYFLSARLITVQGIMKTVIYANFIYCAGKGILFLGHVLGVFNVFDVLQTLGFRFMSMGILGDFSRLQTSVDILTPFLFYFVLQSEYFNLTFPKGFKALYSLVAWMSIALSFSRFLLGVGVISYLLYLVTLRGTKLFKAFLIGATIVIIAIGIVGWENTEILIEKRFFSNETSASDLIRMEQLEDVVTEFEQHPFLGKGLGSYAEGNVRDGELRYSYEVQWAAFLMQFGSIGLFILCIPLAIIFWKLLVPPVSLLRFTFLILFFIWLLSGLTNPFLISLTSGIVYTLFYLASIDH